MIIAYNQSHSPLLRLPTELRHKIYHYLLVARGPIRRNESPHLNILLAILLACRDIYREASSIYRQDNEFELGNYDEDYEWLNALQFDTKQCLRHAELTLNLSRKDTSQFQRMHDVFSLLAQCRGLSLTITLSAGLLFEMWLEDVLRSFLSKLFGSILLGVLSMLYLEMRIGQRSNHKGYLYTCC